MLIKEDGIGMTYRKLVQMIDMVLQTFEAGPYGLVRWKGIDIVVGYN